MLGSYLGACAGFLIRETAAGPLMSGDESRLSTCQGHVNSMFRGSSKIKRTLGIMSAEWFGCVLTLLVVSPEASQHWNLQAVGCGQVLLSKWKPPEEFMTKIIPWGLLLQYPECTVSQS